MNSSTSHFELDAGLPLGRLAIEASAGTGKTHALATLAARYVVEAGVPISEVLVVTFTRAAAVELKDRVRVRLVEFADALADPSAPRDRDADPALASVIATSETERLIRLARAGQAVADFDAAAITTIHGFVTQALQSFGSAIPVDSDAVLVDDASELVPRVVADIYAARALQDSIDGLPSLDEAARVTHTVLGNPGAGLVPDLSLPGSGAMRELIDEICAEVRRRRRDSGSMSFDDVLVTMRDALVDPEGGALIRSILRRRFPIVLIDEFQDTDPVQWEIFDAVFGDSPSDSPDGEVDSTLVIVGDPKQAIYAFRGANVHTYLQAVQSPGTMQLDMHTNWRSDPDVLTALEVLLEGVTFGDPAIGFHPVTAASKNIDRRITGVDGAPVATLDIRLVDGEGVKRRSRDRTHLATTDNSPLIYTDLLVHIDNLLSTASIPSGSSQRRVHPDDIAVLVRAGYEARAVLRVLSEAGVPAVIARAENVFRSEAAQQWYALLRAVALPTSTSRARSFAVGWFGGAYLEGVAELGDDEMAEIQERLRDWGEVLADRGTAAFVGYVRIRSEVARRVLSRPDGDRAMTDLDHIAELLVQMSPGRTTPSGLLGAFTELAGAGSDVSNIADPTSRRVESDAGAVQIMTVFNAKGLEFPIVCVPTMSAMRSKKPDDFIWWDSEKGVRVIDTASSQNWVDETDQQERLALSWKELEGTDLRLLYVALTRARHHTAVWWLPTDGALRSGLAKVLFARDANGAIDPARFSGLVDVPTKGHALNALRPLVDRSGGAISVELIDADVKAPPKRSSGQIEDPGSLDVATLGNLPSRRSRRWSFSLLTSGTYGHDEFADEPAVVPVDEDESTRSGTPETPLPLGAIAGGAGFGNLVHAVFEHVDFAACDLRGDLRRVVDEEILANPWDVDRDELVNGLEAVIDTPVGPLFDDRPLRSLTQGDRLDELRFELTLARGGSASSARGIADALVEGLDRNDPMLDWAEGLHDGFFEVDLAGHLTGSIDLLARIRRDGIPDRFVVCDYKTNRLGPSHRAATASDYAPAGLTREMAKHHYALQALLYCVATHRYLRWRVADYDPRVHLGGVGYLFVRGMAGSDTVVHDGVPSGVFEWHPPAAVIETVSDLLDGMGR